MGWTWSTILFQINHNQKVPSLSSRSPVHFALQRITEELSLVNVAADGNVTGVLNCMAPTLPPP